jgi:predicted phosphodiesterase
MATIRQLGVIGDVHAEDKRLAQALEFLADEGVCSTVCTGDIADGQGCVDSSIRLLKQHQVLTVRGNHDRWLLDDRVRHVSNAHCRGDLHEDSIHFLERLPIQLQLTTVAGSLLLCHGVAKNDLRKVWPGTERMPVESSHELDSIIEDDEHRFVINGHMHFKTMIHFHGLTLINAGTLMGGRWPGFSIIDFEKRCIRAFIFNAEGGLTQTKLTQLDPEPHHQVWENTQAFTGNWEPLLLFDRNLLATQ